jgi:4-amino-4-deoxy-L-arabinose transferase-like glycosyltransferase
VVATAAVAGVVLRIGVWPSHLGRVDADEAITGLAARAALHGSISAFWPGQVYGGTLEPLLTAPLVAAFGPSIPVVRAVPVILAAVASLLTWRLGRYTVGEPAACLGAALFWIAPAYWIWKSERAHDFYGSGLVLELLVLILVVRSRREPSGRHAGLFGFVTGLAWWQTPGIFAAIVPAFAWLVVKQPRALRVAGAALATAVVGAMPWLLSNLRHDWSLSTSSGDTPYVNRLRGFVSSTLPMSFNARVPFTSAWLLGKPLSGLLYFALLGICAFAAWKGRRTDASLLPVIVVAFGPLASISPFTWRVTEPRYETPLMPILALLLAAPIGTRIMPLVKELGRRDITSFCASPTISYRVDFVTDLRVTGAECETHYLRRTGNVVYPGSADFVRFPKLLKTVAARGYPAWAFIKGTPDETRARPMFEATGYRRSVTGVFAVYARAR